jgi:EpsI family protein
MLILSTGVFINNLKDREDVIKSSRLGMEFVNINGWNFHQDIPLTDGILKGLQLDDYLYRAYSKDGKRAVLYIGYYLTGKKVGAAHDPIVCFSGQGWKLSNRNEQIIQVKSRHLTTLPYLTMVANNGRKKILVAYWFQAGISPYTTTLEQKLGLMLSQVLYKRSDNAFIRVSVSLENKTLTEGLKIISDFLYDFYPEFEQYVTN